MRISTRYGLIQLSGQLHHAVSSGIAFMCKQAASNGVLRPTPAFAFDIDGVLKRGSDLAAGHCHHSLVAETRTKRENAYGVQLIPGADAAFKQACGAPEQDRAAKLSELLRQKVPHERLILSHTPMQDLLPEYGDSAVLVVGAAQSLQAAHAYGFSKAVSPLQLAAAAGPSIAPFSTVPSAEDVARLYGLPCPVQAHSVGTEAAPIKAVLVFTDPDDWARDLQLCCDVMLCGGVLSPQHASSAAAQVLETPIYFSQDDLLWANSHHLPRFGLGAFRRALETLYKARTGRGLPLKGVYGKPTAATFGLARRQLDAQARQAGFSHAEPIYMVGDNPGAPPSLHVGPRPHFPVYVGQL